MMGVLKIPADLCPLDPTESDVHLKTDPEFYNQYLDNTNPS